VLLLLFLSSSLHPTSALLPLTSCLSSPCSAGSTCVDAPTGYNCECAPGFTGDDCGNDIDECVEVIDLCLNFGACVNTLGSYRCNCIEGTMGDDCSINPDDCASTTGEVLCKNGG
ncbi:hypothetical protein PFISCL1PPCAC_9382, partial [Pristionchus fissidentatus]